MKKKIMAVFLVLALLIGVIPVTSYAAETELKTAFNEVTIGQSYVNWARITNAAVISAKQLEAEPEADENERVHILVELASGTKDGDVISVEMNVSEQSSSGLASALRANKEADGAGQGKADELFYQVPIENGAGRMMCYSYYDITSLTTFVIDFVVGDTAGQWTTGQNVKANDAVLKEIVIWNQPVMKGMFQNVGKVDGFSWYNGGNNQGLVGYIWLEESVPDDAVIGLEIHPQSGKVRDLPHGWETKGGYVQLVDGEAVVQFSLQGQNPGALGQNRLVTVYFKNHLSYAPELAEGIGETVEIRTEIGLPYTVDYRDYFTDRDDGELTYYVSVNGGEENETNSYKYRYVAKEEEIHTLQVRAYDGILFSPTLTIRIAASGEHAWGEWVVLEEAGCLENGLREHTCVCCYITEEAVIPAAGSHSWTDWVVSKNANCAEDGTKLRTCAACGAMERETIPMGEHDWVVTSNTATCGNAGVETVVCSGCEESQTREVSATGAHTWEAWVTETEAGCAVPGLEARNCAACGEREEQQIPATNIHAWSEWETTQEPSCVEGTRERTCSDCEETETVTIDANGIHQWELWEVFEQPTPEEEGVEIRVCKYCDEAEFRVIYYKDPIAYVNINISGTTHLAMAEVPLEDCNGVEGITIDDILLMAHALYAPNGTEDYASYDHRLISMLWSDQSGSFGYTVNAEFAWDLQDPVANGDVVDAFVYIDPQWTDQYSYFDHRLVSVDVNQSFELTLFRMAPYGADYKTELCSGAEIYIDGEKTEYRTDAEGKVTIKLEKGGRHTIIAKTSSKPIIIPAVCIADVDSAQVEIQPPVLTDALATATSITVTAPEPSAVDPNATVEYSLRQGEGEWSKWQISPLFEQLDNNTEYQIRARFVTSDADLYITSESSEVLTVMTADGPSAMYTFEDVQGRPGEILQIPVELSCEVEDMCRFNAALEFDTGIFTLVGIEPGADGEDWTMKVNRMTNCVSGQREDAVDGMDGELFVLILKLKEGVAPGAYSVGLTEDWNVASGNAFWNTRQAYITVTGRQKAAAVEVSQPENTLIQAGTAVEYADVQQQAWYADEVAYVTREKLMNGTDTGTFSPEETTTRAMLVTVLYRMEGSPVSTQSVAFADVDRDSYYYDAVRWAYENGIVKGVSEAEFAPDENVTRQQMAAILYRYAQYHNVDVAAGEEAASFADYGSVADYAAGAMDWAVESGLINGMEGLLVPEGSATRAQLAAILSRYFG